MIEAGYNQTHIMLSWKPNFPDIGVSASTAKITLEPKISEYFAARRLGIFFFHQLLGDRTLQNILNVALLIEHNPIARYLVERHTAVHEGLVTFPKAWAILCPRADHWHVMAGPILDRGQLVGAVGCTRDKSMPAFDTQNLADLSAAMVAQLSATQHDLPSVKLPSSAQTAPPLIR